MISLELSEEQQVVQSAMADFAKGVIEPVARDVDEAGRVDDDILTSLWSCGLVASQAEDDDQTAVTNAIVLEELGAADISLATALASSMAFVRAVQKQGSFAQRDSVIKPLLESEMPIAAVAVQDAQFVEDPSGYSTRAIEQDDGYSITGRKAMVPLAKRCSHFLVLASNDGKPDAFIIPADAEGLKIVPVPGTLGMRGIEMGELDLQNVSVPKNMRLGEGNGADIQALIDGARIGVAAMLTGLCRKVREYVVPHAKERVVHGVPLAQKQSAAFKIADMHMETESLRTMVWRAAWQINNGENATRAAQLAYTYAGEKSVKIADDGLQLFGGYGFIREYPLEMWYRNARALSAMDGVVGI